MKDYQFCFTLASDAVFGSAERSSPLIDLDVQHDRYGLPYLPGRTLKGVLRESCAEILFSLEQIGAAEDWIGAAQRLFGTHGDTQDENVILRVRDARLPHAQHAALRAAVDDEAISRFELLDALTTVRAQTSVDMLTGSAQAKSLRRTRVILRETRFEAQLTLMNDASEQEDLALLAASIKGLQRVGATRNRGLGTIKYKRLCDPQGKDILTYAFKPFMDQLTGGA
jgi:CRISPR/Cas system CSM-associated protein Csm3 (group 7 of RAMP superfamily)